MEQSNIEKLFNWLDKTTEVIQQHENEPYLDSLAVSMELLYFGSVSSHMDEILSYKLNTYLEELDIQHFTPAEMRKAIQLALLKGMRDSTQSQHLITPETVAMLIGYFAGKLTKGKEKIRVFDPACGTANLLTTVLASLNKPTEAFGSEIDPTLIKLALLNANLQKMQVEFFHQDSLRPFLIDPVDLVIADLPVGYYPDDIRANEYQLKADKGHSYSHHLFIEQSLNYTKEDGYVIFLIPDFLFDSDQSDKLHKYIQRNANIIGVLRLPESAFTTEKNIKSILILQKKGQNVAPKQPLLVNLPSFKNKTAMNDILEQINGWFSNYDNQG